MILSSILTLLKNNLSHLYNAFIKESITAIENLSFEIYFRFSRIQTHRIFYFLRRLFAKHQTLTSKCWMSSSWSRSHKIRLYCCHSNIDFIWNFIFTNFNPHVANYWWKFYSDRTRKKSQNIGMASEKLYRDTLKQS